MTSLEEKKVRIILALSEAKNAAPVGYVCQKCGIDDACENPCRHLRQLEEDGVIRRLSPNSWSPALEPQYELPNRTKNLLQQLVATRLEQLINVRA